MRLIDADILIADICQDQCERKYCDCDCTCSEVALVVDAPTITPEPGWISVNEKMPDEGIMVLTAIYGTDVIMPMDGETMEEAVECCLHRPARVSIGFIDQGGYWCGADGWPEVIQPKYWMEMPEPPKEET